ncbi:hypothetical protein [Haloechinothrix sp. LS1_15]|uniref:hypothetical protein n=1 Tax=Haloechinothrix sp. LS1_15 TaxID=2652248 RepID=UPI0029485848|nr:hypothetical protein [Haloechinothrix sp. LS1_15]MDV6014508.1 hypothetical protein [Haloechinothrix sp. LS1_15]
MFSLATPARPLTGTVEAVLLAQLDVPEWAPLALKLASLAAILATLTTVLVAWRNLRDRDRDE